jgi:hypothetical protein
MNQGTQGYSLMKKTEGRKSRDTVSLKDNQYRWASRVSIRHLQTFNPWGHTWETQAISITAVQTNGAHPQQCTLHQPVNRTPCTLSPIQNVLELKIVFLYSFTIEANWGHPIAGLFTSITREKFITHAPSKCKLLSNLRKPYLLFHLHESLVLFRL